MTLSSIAARLALSAVLLAMAGCTSTSQIDTALDVGPAPAGQPLPPPSAPGSDPAVAPGGFPAQPGNNAAAARKAPPEDLVPAIAVRNTGTFPNINDERAPALQPLSPEERQAMIARMEELGREHAAGRISTADYQARMAYLRRLAQSHSREMLNRIEGQP